jgi:DNA-directed RNA polymerase subunit RPC12/RpoP
MNDVLKRRISIGVSICCLSLAIGITVYTNFSGGYDVGSNEPVQMLCTNPKCGQAFELSGKEFSKLISRSQNDKMMMPVEAMAFNCSKCNQKSAHTAMKCAKCGNVFVPNYQDPGIYDKCPKCGFSRFQQESQEQK